jgi:hypothetical protein
LTKKLYLHSCCGGNLQRFQLFRIDLDVFALGVFIALDDVLSIHLSALVNVLMMHSIMSFAVYLVKCDLSGGIGSGEKFDRDRN